MSNQDQIKLAEELKATLTEIGVAEANVAQLRKQRSDILEKLIGVADRMAPTDAKEPEPKDNYVEPKSTEVEDEPKPEAAPEPIEEPVDPLEGAKAMDEALAAYDASIELASPSQGKMIFGMLGREFGLTSPEDKKAVIIGYVNKGQKEPIITSTTKLTKVQAGDLITWLQKVKRKDLDEFLEGVAPF